MKLLNLLFGMLVFVAFSCTKSKPMSDLEFYGNTFIKMSDEVFEAPDDWIRVVLGDGEFEISIPPAIETILQMMLKNLRIKRTFLTIVTLQDEVNIIMAESL